MIVGHEAGIFGTKEEFERFTDYLVKKQGWKRKDKSPLFAGQIGEMGTYFFEATPEEQQRILAGENWLEVIGG